MSVGTKISRLTVTNMDVELREINSNIKSALTLNSWLKWEFVRCHGWKCK